MAQKRKRQFGSWTDAEIAYKEANHQNGAMQIAITELVRGGVAWTTKKGKKIGTCRLSAPHGGVIILSENGYSSAKYVEDWLQDMFTLHAPALNDHQAYDDWVTLRELAHRVREDQVLAMNTAAKREASGVSR